MPPPSDISLHTPVRSLPGVRTANADALAALGVHQLGHLAAYLPMRHELLEAETTINLIRPDSMITARGEVTATRSMPGRGGRKPRFEAVLMDDTGRLDLVWFNAPYMRRTIHPGMRLRVHGEARAFGPGVQVANPKYTILNDSGPEPAAEGARVRPVYPASEKIGSAVIEQIIADALPLALPMIDDHLSEEYRRRRELPELREAYRMIHRPGSEPDVIAARRRLAYDELLLLQLGVQMKRVHLRTALRSPPLAVSPTIDRHIRARFPFELTPDQNSVIRDVADDVARATPSNRLIQGDVGSGKTIVALYAMLLAVASKHQAALMAPTELLAEQHFSSISRMLEGSKVRMRLLTGALSARERASALDELARGEIDIAIGTHSLISPDVAFHSLAVAIIDEQHRFGVHQRASLRSKGGAADGADQAPAGGPAAPLTPHVLVMTATPIPRTLALTLFGDLDVSTIRSLPPGRKPVRTRVVPASRSEDVYRFLRRRVEAGDQAYVVAPAIDADRGDRATDPGGVDDPESRDDRPGVPAGGVGVRSIESLSARLRGPGGALEGVPVAAMHGRLSEPERDSVMSAFRAGATRVLIATTVIEVGVDVPGANIMIVEHAERFGLSQLHQLRGRVGRGRRQSVCILMGDPVTEEASRRLDVMRRVSDGFVLAERDFEIRGPGEVLGARQSGLAPFKVADLMRDRDLLRLATRDAQEWIARSPTLSGADEALVRRRLLKAHGPWIGIADVG
ncbi:MAG: ATP-dependent DNA helicase RecG [Phycisphaerales bacterium]